LFYSGNFSKARGMGKVVQVQPQQHSLDKIKWALVWGIVLVCSVGNIYYRDAFSFSMRVSVMIVLGLVAFFLASSTIKGQIALKFIKDARSEMRKIVWPTRQETTQTTLVVAAFVVVMSLILWGFDVLFASIINRIVG
jgi:preprotein translocase subunit SecE